MADYKLRIENDEVYSYYPLPQYGEGISSKELVMTKEVFIKCYEEWILKDKKMENDINITKNELPIRELNEEQKNLLKNAMNLYTVVIEQFPELYLRNDFFEVKEIVFETFDILFE